MNDFNHIDLIQFPQLETFSGNNGCRLYTTPQGKVYPSITTVLGESIQQSLQQWRNRVGDEAADKKMKKAARRGTGLHDMTEQYLLNNPEYTAGFDSSSKFLFNNFKQYLDQIDNIVALEKTLYSDVFKVAGRCDCIADFQGKKSVIDFKTAEKTKKREWITNYFLQTTFYSCAVEELFGIKIPNIVIISTHEDGTSTYFMEKRKNYVDLLHDTLNEYRPQLMEKEYA